MRRAAGDAAEALASVSRGWRLILLAAAVSAVAMFATGVALVYFVPAPSPPAPPSRAVSCVQ